MDANYITPKRRINSNYQQTNFQNVIGRAFENRKKRLKTLKTTMRLVQLHVSRDIIGEDGYVYHSMDTYGRHKQHLWLSRQMYWAGEMSPHLYVSDP
jgi:hypothetical protein